MEQENNFSLAIDWETITPSNIDTLVIAFEKQNNRICSLVNNILESVHAVGSDKKNIPIVLNLLEGYGIEMPEDFDQWQPHNIALWTYMKCNEDAWDNITKFTQAQPGMRGWKKVELNVPADAVIDLGDEKLSSINNQICALISRRQSRRVFGQYAYNEWKGKNRYLFLFEINEPIANQSEWNENDVLEEKPFKGVSRIELIYEGNEKDVHCKADFDAKTRKEICMIWAKEVFGATERPRKRGVVFNIQQYKDVNMVTIRLNETSQISGAKVTKLGIEIGQNTGEKRTFEKPDNFYESVSRVLSQDPIEFDRSFVLWVNFHLDYTDLRGRPKYFDLKVSPQNSNLHNAPEEIRSDIAAFMKTQGIVSEND